MRRWHKINVSEREMHFLELLPRGEAPADNFLLLRWRQRFGRGENISFRPPPAFFFAELLFLLSSRSADVTRHLQKEREEEKEEGDSPKNEMCHLETCTLQGSVH